MVSVNMLTYNHEKYIAQAIEGVMMQVTTFPFELIIGEDCSTDNTRKICKEYQVKYPDKIHLLLPEKNLGMQANSIVTLNACTGKYIAICEGDDYWTDPLKLQKQVDFLETNKDFSICFHPVKISKDNELIDDYITSEVPETTDIMDLTNCNYIHTPSVVFRKNNKVLDEFKTINAPIGDYVLHMLNAKYGKIKKHSDCMGVYRVHDGGIHSLKTQDQKNDQWLTQLSLMIPCFKDTVKKRLIGNFINFSKIVLFDFQITNQRKFEILHQLYEFEPNIGFELIQENKKLNLQIEEYKKKTKSIKFTANALIRNLIRKIIK